MGTRIFKQPRLDNPVLIAAWPGIGNIGIIAVNAMRVILNAEPFAEIEPWEFFYPQKVVIKHGVLQDLVFPASRFYSSRVEGRDLVFFVGEEQPTDGERAYAEGSKGYQIANLVLDVAHEIGCQRIYTSGAAVTEIHHSARPKVWAVPNSPSLLPEIKTYENTVLMSAVGERHGKGYISGLNGLLLGAARKHGIDAVCLMGEIPSYLQGFSLPYPRASRSVIEVLKSALGVSVDLREIDALIKTTDQEIERLYESFAAETKGQLDKLKQVASGESNASLEVPRPITDEDKQQILDDIEKFFNKGSRGD
jgi:uncharacterized protein